MSKTKFKTKKNFQDFDDLDHRRIKKQRSMSNQKQFRQIDNVLKTKNVNKILSFSDESFKGRL